MEKALNFKINFQDLVFEFGQNMYWVLKKNGNSKWKRSQKCMSRISLKAALMTCYAM